MRPLAYATVIAVAFLLSKVAHADEPTFAPDASARYRVEAGGGLVREGGGKPILGSARLGLGYDFSEHVGVVFDARHLFVPDRAFHPMDDTRQDYDDFALGLRLRAPLGHKVELFFTPMLLTSRFGLGNGTVWGTGAELRAGLEVWLGGALWVGASASSTFSWAGEDMVEFNGSTELYLTARF